MVTTIGRVALGVLAAHVATTTLPSAVLVVDAYPGGVGSCVPGFAKFPYGSEHNWQESTRAGGGLNDNYGDVAFSGMTVTLGDVELSRPSGSDSFHYTGGCGPDYPCGLCQGSCDDDDGCAEGLECFVREGDEEVPGCGGTVGLWGGTSYCYDPTAGGGGGGDGDGDGDGDGGDGSTRRLQGQQAEVPSGATFLAGTPYRIKLETPADDEDVIFKGYMFRLEGDEGQDLSGSIEIVSENMQILEPTGEGLGDGVNVQATCAPTVAAVSHTEAEEKTSVEAVITVPSDQAGRASFEVTVMVNEHEWYMTNYALQFDPPADAAEPETDPEPEPEPAPTTDVGDATSEISPQEDSSSTTTATGTESTSSSSSSSTVTVGGCTFPSKLTCAKVTTAPTLDGDLSDWSTDSAVSTPITAAMGSTLYASGDLTMRCSFDDTHLHLAIEVPGPYRFSTDDDHLAAAISTMMKIGPDAEYVHMGGCPQAIVGCPNGVPDECWSYVVDVGAHWELSTTEQGVRYGVNSDTGDDAVANKDDEYSVSSYCRMDDDVSGENDRPGNEWEGAWAHTEKPSVTSVVPDVSRSGFTTVEGADGVYIFELSRTLVTPSPATDAQLEPGKTYSFGVAYWDPWEDRETGWTKAGHYVTGCSKEWMDLVLDDGTVQQEEPEEEDPEEEDPEEEPKELGGEEQPQVASDSTTSAAAQAGVGAFAGLASAIVYALL